MKIPLGLIFLALTLVEVALLIKVGSIVGPFTLLLLLALSAAFGVHVLRSAGTAVARAYDPAQPNPAMLSAIADDSIAVAAGFALIAPCVLSKGLALLALVPAVRVLLVPRVRKSLERSQAHVVMTAPARHNPGSRPNDVIEGEFERIKETPAPARDP